MKCICLIVQSHEALVDWYFRCTGNCFIPVYIAVSITPLTPKSEAEGLIEQISAYYLLVKQSDK